MSTCQAIHQPGLLLPLINSVPVLWLFNMSLREGILPGNESPVEAIDQCPLRHACLDDGGENFVSD